MGCFQRIRDFFRNNILAKPIDDDLFFSLNVWDKLRNYRRVPIKLVINVIVCIVLTVYAIDYQLFVSDYAVKSRYAVAIALIEPEDETDKAFDKQIANIGEFKEFLEGFIEGYHELPMSSLGVFMHFSKSIEDNSPLPVELYLRYATDKNYVEFRERTFELTDDDPLGPFGNVSMLFPQTETCMPETDSNGNSIVPCRNDTLADFFDVLQNVKLTARIRGLEVNPAFTFASVTKWKVETTFGFSAHNSILRAKTAITFQETQRLRTEPIIIALSLLVISLWGLVLRLYFFLRHFDYASKALSPALLRRYRETVSWHYFGIIAGLMTIVFCVVTLASAFLNFVDYHLVQWRAITLAFAVFFEYVLLLSHFQNVPRMYVIAQSITTALPLLSTYFVSIFPIFFGFALASSSALGGVSEIFDSLPHSMITLFCMICGDSLIDIYTMSNTTNFSWLKGFNSLILAAFLFIFIPNILNIALSLVQDSYAWVTETHDVEERIHKRIQRSQQIIPSPSKGGGGGGNKKTAVVAPHSLAGAISAIKAGLISVNDLEVSASGLLSDPRKRFGGALLGGANVGVGGAGAGERMSLPPVDPFDEAELEQLRQRFTVRKSGDSSSDSDSDEAERDEYIQVMHEREELHFHRRRFHSGIVRNKNGNRPSNHNSNNNNDEGNNVQDGGVLFPGSSNTMNSGIYMDDITSINTSPATSRRQHSSNAAATGSFTHGDEGGGGGNVSGSNSLGTSPRNNSGNYFSFTNTASNGRGFAGGFSSGRNVNGSFSRRNNNSGGNNTSSNRVPPQL